MFFIVSSCSSGSQNEAGSAAVRSPSVRLCAPRRAGARLASSRAALYRIWIVEVNWLKALRTPGSQLTPSLPSDWLPVAPLGRLHSGEGKKKRILAGILGHGAVVMLHSRLMGILQTWRPSNAIIEVLWRFRLLLIIILIIFFTLNRHTETLQCLPHMTNRK